MSPLVDCPICGRKAEFAPSNRWRPFCSERCKMIDLGAWATGSYSIGSDSDDADTPSPDDSDDTTTAPRR